MRDDKAIKGKNYKKNRDGLELSKFVTTALSKSGNERKLLVSLYPDLHEAQKHIGWFLSPRRAQIGKVLKPLAQAYKKEIKN